MAINNTERPMRYHVAKAFVEGNFGRDPEMRYTPTGLAVTDVSLAVSQGDTTEWVRVTAWERAAEQLNTNFLKGDHVLIEGRIGLDRYQANDGTMRAALRVTVNDARDIRLLHRTASSQAGGGDDIPFGTLPEGDAPLQDGDEGYDPAADVDTEPEAPPIQIAARTSRRRAA